jgi:hypothetical protein
MAETPSNEQQATSLLSQIPLGAIIGSPLKAAIDAQAAAAAACVDFITKVGFVAPTGSAAPPVADAQLPAKDGVAAVPVESAPYGVRDITFSFVRRTEAGNTTVNLTVPLLTIMPLPFIRIESMTVSFKASISAIDTHSSTDTASAEKALKVDGTLGFAWWKMTAGGSISSKKDSTSTNTSKYSVEHTMDISVHAVQDDMPAGLAKLLSVLTDEIKAVTAPVHG